MNVPNHSNTLYLPIKRVFFNDIVSGVKGCEFREIKEGITANKHLLRDSDKKYVLNPDCTSPERTYYIDDYNDGKFPFLPKPYKYLYLAVGYAKERDTALVEVTGFSFEPQMIRTDREGKPKYCFWIIAFHLGKVIELHRKNR